MRKGPWKGKENDGSRRSLLEAAAVYTAFCGLSVLSRFILPLFLLVIIFGMAFPPIWARRNRGWSEIGLTRRNLDDALLWGALAGSVTAIITVVLALLEGNTIVPPLLVVNLAVGIPVWLLIMSPFQEFLFRGWIQPRFQDSLGEWSGLTVASLCFSFWHLFPPFEGARQTTISVFSIRSLIIMFAFAMILGYSLQRTKSVVAPWFAHAITGIALIITGQMVFVYPA